ncbi:MAG TPA: hypothetical protein VH989_00920 [Actinomycetota bacterium]|jgi:hypothetical protein
MPMVQGLSKKAANYRPATSERVRCHTCKFMFPPLAVGGCRYVRGIVHAGDVCDEFKPRKAATP